MHEDMILTKKLSVGWHFDVTFRGNCPCHDAAFHEAIKEACLLYNIVMDLSHRVRTKQALLAGD